MILLISILHPQGCGKWLILRWRLNSEHRPLSLLFSWTLKRLMLWQRRGQLTGRRQDLLSFKMGRIIYSAGTWILTKE